MTENTDNWVRVDVARNAVGLWDGTAFREVVQTDAVHQALQSAGLLRECLRKLAWIVRKRATADLVEACEYAAGSFAQVPADRTVPPIVLHDCREKLEEAVRKAREAE